MPMVSLFKGKCNNIGHMILYLIVFCNIYVLQAVKTRFASILESKDSLLAAATLPKFKLRWMKENETA